MTDDDAALYIGLISGTSADSIDAVLVHFDQGLPKTLACHAHP
ncbi:MAG: anhydro-N-acetylmuramic acid kinase, partial [Rhodanobacter sp.]